MTNSLSIAAIILAAGESRRFGAPKVLQRFNGKPFLTRITDALRQAGIKNIYLILGYQAESMIPRLPDAGKLNIIVNHHFKFGQFSSLQAGIRELESETSGILQCLIDQPHIHVSTYKKIVDAVFAHSQNIIVPQRQQHGGHPVFIPSWLFSEITTALPQSSLRQIFLQHSNDVKRIEVDDPGIRKDIDTPDDLNRLESSHFG